MRFVLVAGEVSGDLLGAALIRELRERFPKAQFEGIGGEAMRAEGFYSLVPMERLSVMGLWEVLGRLRELLRLRKDLASHYSTELPTAFIGIDAPDFNLGLSERLRAVGVPCIQFVSPSIWAWRKERVAKMVNQIDLMLTLFPFEVAPYREQGIRVDFVGHPLADTLAFNPSKDEARKALGLEATKPTLAVLPGSRMSEVKRLSAVFSDTVIELSGRVPDLQVVIPAATPRLAEFIKKVFGDQTVVIGQSHQAMAAADVVLLASGTAALEAALIGRPMVVAYKLNPITALWVKSKLQVEHVSLPNHLTDTPRVPEFLQGYCKAKYLVPALDNLFKSDNAETVEAFQKVHSELSRGAAGRAASAVRSFLKI